MNVRLTIAIAALFVASLASAQTYMANLPDAVLINISPANSIAHIYEYPMVRVSQSVYGTADCASQGTQGNPGTYYGYGIGGRIGFNSDNMPSSKIPSCYTIYTSLNASTYSYHVDSSGQLDGIADHLYQGLYINADGSLPGGQPGTSTQAESCSLVGNNGGIGSPHLTDFNSGVCYYYSYSGTPQVQ